MTEEEHSLLKDLFQSDGDKDAVSRLFDRSRKPKEKARQERQGGYRGYHFTAYPAPGSTGGWTPLYCEIQIKTIIEEAWDAKTHELVYKRKRAIPEQQDFADLNKLLGQVEEILDRIGGRVEDRFREMQSTEKWQPGSTLLIQ